MKLSVNSLLLKCVILDSPCLYEEMVEKGIKLVQKYDAKYKYIECYLDDFEEINHRLKNREKMLSQISEIRSKEGFYATLSSAKKPADFNCLVVDTSQPIERYIENVIRYIKFHMPRGIKGELNRIKVIYFVLKPTLRLKWKSA